ncbi:hypothetical protein N657DRAFT_633556 [Parathielavia appendiculata]|uniref:Aminoglycoside phosphotransferase domain-containing protein n=1 Tax=Parathielavia appendiculata TaxID=2587402 RepID=A0AAN6Z423_9PEZI|nr:hypothetical protein N657DRAFT_633556 [Parathielavia appendiculata]
MAPQACSLRKTAALGPSKSPLKPKRPKTALDESLAVDLVPVAETQEETESAASSLVGPMMGQPSPVAPSILSATPPTVESQRWCATSESHCRWFCDDWLGSQPRSSHLANFPSSVWLSYLDTQPITRSEGEMPPPLGEVLPLSTIANNSENDDAVENLRRRIRAKKEELWAKGLPVTVRASPPRRPRPPRGMFPPYARQLLDAGSEFVHKGQHRWVIKHACGTKVTRFDPTGILPGEPEAMRFAAEHTSIPVACVYEVAEDHFTMDFVQGQPLVQGWGTTLSAEDRALPAARLKSPDGVICSFGSHPAIERPQVLPLRGELFANEAEYNEFLLGDLFAIDVVHDMIRKQMRTDHGIVLTHGGLRSNNFLVRPGVGVVAIIDWRYANYYYPEIFPQRYDDQWFVDQVLIVYARH